MDRDERIHQFAINMEKFGDYVLEWDVEHFDYDKTAAALDKLGYHRTIWHKVADGDYPEEEKYVLCFTEYNEMHVWKLRRVGDAPYWADSEDHYHGHVVAWTELPIYEEK